MLSLATRGIVFFALTVGSSALGAQAPIPYGAPVTLDAAKRASAAAIAMAREKNWTIAVAIVDPGGILVYFERMDATQNGSAAVAIDKARSAALFKRPTKWFHDALAAGGEGWRMLQLQGAVAIDGGIPLVVDGKIVGAIGVSGASSSQDGQAAQAGVDAVSRGN
ncbi:MAG: heme-binding protein [Gemmatimonadaceae bacterium]|nr:heme-binding protein [Gemmatimonadaceae bacterium]